MQKNKVKNNITLIIFTLMVIIFTSLSIIMLMNNDNLNIGSSIHLKFAFIWYVLIAIISGLSIIMLYQIPKFDTAFLRGGYISYVSESPQKWYLTSMFVTGSIMGISSGFTFSRAFSLDPSEVYAYYGELWVYILIISAIPTIIFIVINIIKFKIIGLIRSLLFMVLGAGYFMMGWLIATILITIFLFYVLSVAIRYLLNITIFRDTRYNRISRLEDEVRRLKEWL